MMKENKIVIIDKTVVVLKEIYGDRLIKKIPKIRELIRLLYLIGSDYIEITQELYEELSPLPEEVKYKIARSRVIEMKNNYYCYESIKKECDIKTLKDIRIVGLEDIIFYDYEKIFSEIINIFGQNIEMCIKNKFGSSTAMTLEWLKLGGEKVITSFAGIGGFASFEEIIGSIKFLEIIEHSGNCKLFPEASNIFEEITESKIKNNAPFIGKDIFNVESGIHVNGIVKNPNTYEPYDPIEIGRKRNIIIGKHSGTNALEIKLKELNLNFSENSLNLILENIRQISTQKRRGLNNDEIKEICNKCCV